MGAANEYRCMSCGYTKEVWFGCGFMGSPSNPETRRDVMEGKYGKRPKAVLEAHPGAGCGAYMAMFRCKCGNINSKEAVFIGDADGTYYKPSMRCGFCHSKMWEIQEPPRSTTCPKCGFWMDSYRTLLWD